MVFMNKTLSFVLLIALMVSAANLGVLVEGAHQAKRSLPKTSCPVHAISCCCPELCNASRLAWTKKECHRTSAASEDSKTTSSFPATACILRPGCAEPDIFNVSGLLIKDFIPQSREQLTLKPLFSYFTCFFHSPPLNGYQPIPFQPPRSLPFEFYS